MFSNSNCNKYAYMIRWCDPGAPGGLLARLHYGDGISRQTTSQDIEYRVFVVSFRTLTKNRHEPFRSRNQIHNGLTDIGLRL